ncbi:MAG: hypothetical protein KDC69_05155 [Flavobacteriaceae bacterium]|nr:hypothetical protein [Flavobacteriaceae bacterium]
MKVKLAKLAGMILGVLILVTLVGYKILYKPHRNIAEEMAAYELNTADFIKEFKDNAPRATEKYLNKVIMVDGTVSEIDGDGLTINGNIYAQFDSNAFNSLIEGNPVKIKGRCIGYDDLLETVKLDQCTLSN